MVSESMVGWCFVAAGVLLLTASGTLQLFAGVAPVSLLLGWRLVRSGGTDNHVPGMEKKG